MAKGKKSGTRSKKAKGKAGLKDLDAKGTVKGGFNPQPEPPRNRGGGTISNPAFRGFAAGRGGTTA
jgi:hypothetical protein